MNASELKTAIDTPEMHSMVETYLLAKTYAAITREQVDITYHEILTDIPVFADDIEGRRARSGQRLYKVGDLYLCSDDELCQRIYAEGDKRLKAKGIKPADMERDYCPALCAENDLRKIARLIANAAGKPLGIDADDLLCSKNGLERYKQFVELTVSAIVNSPTL